MLGAGHAALPGHGKTVVAAYLAGRHGRPRDAVAVGATVTVAHTGAVLVVGLLLSTTTALAGDRLLGYLGVASGALIVAVGVGMLAAVLRKKRAHGHHEHDHGHDDHQQPRHGQGQEHRHGHGLAGAVHTRSTPGGGMGLAGIGVAGGLVPSPSALVVLLAAVGLGRTVFGVLLVIAYGVGMAATLTAAGLLLLAVQRRITRSRGRLARLGAALARVAPMVTAGLIVVVGFGLAARAAAGLA